MEGPYPTRTLPGRVARLTGHGPSQGVPIEADSADSAPHGNKDISRLGRGPRGSGTRTERSLMTCFKCNEHGHLAKDCKGGVSDRWGDAAGPGQKGFKPERCTLDQISKAHHWSLSLVLVDDNVETPEEEEAREEDEMEQEALGYKQAQERERRVLAGRTPCTSGPIGKTNPKPDTGGPSGGPGGPGGPARGSAEGLMSAPEMVKELTEKLGVAGVWGRAPQGWRGSEGLVRERCKLPRALLPSVLGEGGRNMARVAEVAGVMVTLQEGSEGPAMLVVEGRKEACRRAIGIIKVKLKEQVQKDMFRGGR